MVPLIKLHLRALLSGIIEWVIPEKIHTPPMDGTLEILTGGGGSRALEIQVGGGGLDLKLFFGGH